MFYLYVTIGILIGIGSLAFVSQATLGVWMIGAACFLGILGRLSQAEHQHRQTVRLMRSGGQDDAAEPLSTPQLVARIAVGFLALMAVLYAADRIL